MAKTTTLPLAGPLTGAEALIASQDGQSVQVPMEDVVDKAREGAEELTAELREPLAGYIGDDAVVPLYLDANGRLVVGVDRATGKLVNPAIPETRYDVFLGQSGQALYIGSDDVLPLVLDLGGRVLTGFNRTTGAFVGVATSAGGGEAAPPTLIAAPRVPLTTPIIPKAYNHRLSYGQSLSVGAAAGALLSITQPYANVTFAGGPRAWDGATWDFGAFKPLVEDQVSPAPDASTNRKETLCSGSANYTTECLIREGWAPDDHIILASTAGHGGYRIDQLDSSAPWYANLLAHVSGAQALSTDHAVHALDWIQGENNVGVTNFATYRADLEQFQVDAETDIIAITSQASPVYLLTYQLSYGVKTSPDIALAHLDLAQKNPKFFLTTPTYHLPYGGDNVHLTALGYKWIGAYHGRAYAELVLGFQPQWLNPVSATVRGAEIRVRFDVPTLPLVLDTEALAVTTDHGFAVTDDAAAAEIESIAVSGRDVVITLSDIPTGDVVVRYALDHLGAGLTITNGASGNLRDSTPDTAMISGLACPLWHVSPAFQLNAIALEA
ncbi:hypothetical protein [Brevundimonas sp. UBA7664]|uniref:hypothetical protein n=1 Tax=Brevundimonas sp. UBA7664 TaxID=1946141 RepID=UPI0025BB4FB7|nr:hypothetical protein [Brevundimonas sp. UBA7664]